MKIILSYALLIATYSVWSNVFFYLFFISTIGTIILSFMYLKMLNRKNNDITTLQNQNAAKNDRLRNDHEETLERLRDEMLKKEEDRTRQWMESEKETLHVLNGVSQVLELSENIGRVESEKIINKLNEIKSIVVKKNDDHEENG